jgi:hypothetical protein
MEVSIETAAFEMQPFGIDLKSYLFAKGKPLIYSEQGLGGCTDNKKLPSNLDYVRVHPFSGCGGWYSSQLDPWKVSTVGARSSRDGVPLPPPSSSTYVFLGRFVRHTCRHSPSLVYMHVHSICIRCFRIDLLAQVTITAAAAAAAQAFSGTAEYILHAQSSKVAALPWGVWNPTCVLMRFAGAGVSCISAAAVSAAGRLGCGWGWAAVPH